MDDAEIAPWRRMPGQRVEVRGERWFVDPDGTWTVEDGSITPVTAGNWKAPLLDIIAEQTAINTMLMSRVGLLQVALLGAQGDKLQASSETKREQIKVYELTGEVARLRDELRHVRGPGDPFVQRLAALPIRRSGRIEAGALWVNGDWYDSLKQEAAPAIADAMRVLQGGIHV